MCKAMGRTINWVRKVIDDINKINTTNKSYYKIFNITKI